MSNTNETKTGTSTGTIVGIAVTIMAVVIVRFVVIIPLTSAMNTNTQQNEQHVAFCNNWKLQIEERRSHLDDDWIYSQYKWDQFNEQVDDFNAQCATPN